MPFLSPDCVLGAPCCAAPVSACHAVVPDAAQAWQAPGAELGRASAQPRAVLAVPDEIPAELNV